MKFPRLLSFAFLLSLVIFPSAFASFSDVPEDHPNYKGISYLELQGAIDSGRNFRPDDPINKAEFYKILLKIFGETGENVSLSVAFSDVPQDAWFAPFVELALRYDLISSSQSYFKPEIYVNRSEALKILFKIYNVAAPLVPVDQREQLFNDIYETHPRYSVIHRAVDFGIIEANVNKNYYAYKSITRSEFADLVFDFDQWYLNQPDTAIGTLQGIHKSEILADIWSRIVNNYYILDDFEIDEEVLFQAAVKGMIQSLEDPFSLYFPPTNSSDFVEAITGEFEGIGVYIIQDSVKGKFFITEFVAGSNAKEVGMLVGDEIDEVDGVPTVGLSIEELTKRIRGPAGTTVTLKIRRNERSFTFDIERRELRVSSEFGEIIENDVWYVDINLFSNTSFIDVNQLMLRLADKVPEPRAIVIDLRGNGGGFIGSALSIAGHFVPNSAPLVQLDYGDFSMTTYNSGRGEYFGIPTYVFVDDFTASASEILAAALREQADAIIIGTSTFGKGTAQEITQYWDGSILKLTIAEWLTSEGNRLQAVGLEPDIEITQKSDYVDLWLDEFKKQLQ